jgi:O-antigen/teichoic acid export membrane protein
MNSTLVSKKRKPRAKPEDSERHFRIDDLHTSIRGRAVSSGMVTLAAQSVKFLVNLGGMMVLARMLAPKDFGIIGMVAGITAFLAMFTDLGLSSATIQSNEINHAQASNLFWINVGLSGLMGAVAAGLAPVVAWFYHDTRLLTVSLALALAFPLTGVAYQHRAVLIRQMAFRRIAVIEVGSLFFSMVVACTMARLQYGYWSLVGMQLSLAASSSGLTWLVSHWRPSWPTRKGHEGKLLKFGLELSASSFIYYIARGCDTMLLGKFWGATITGYYTRAYALLVRPIDQVLSPIGSVMLPVLGRLRSDPVRYRRVFLQMYDALGLVFFPMAAIFLATARPLVLTLLGPQWGATATLFSGFTFAVIYLPYATAAIWAFTSQARSRDLLTATIVLNALMAASFFIGVRHGALSLVLWYSISGLVVRLPLLYHLAGRSGPVRIADYWRGFLQHLPVWAIVYAASTLGMRLTRVSAPLLQLAIAVPLGLLAAAGAILVFRPQRHSALFIYNSVRTLWAKRQERLRVDGSLRDSVGIS